MSKSSSFLYDRTLDEYIEFYNKLPKVRNMKWEGTFLKDNLDFHNLLLKNGHSPALCYVKKHVEHIPLNGMYYNFVFNNPMFWVIPVETIDNTIVGFLLKGFFKKNYNWIHYSKISLLFGFEDFIDFTIGTPIILCEGWRDCLYIKQFYPYCLALNTSSINAGTMELIKCLTDKIILIYDHDRTGILLSEKNQKQFHSEGIYCEKILPQLKDMGEYFLADKSYADRFEFTLQKTFEKINSFQNNNSLLEQEDLLITI